MSELSFWDRHREEIASASLGYGYGILNATCLFVLMKGVMERDVPLMAIMFATAIGVTFCYNAMLRMLELMGKDDGEKQHRYELLFKIGMWVGFVEFAVLFRLFILG